MKKIIASILVCGFAVAMVSCDGGKKAQEAAAKAKADSTIVADSIAKVEADAAAAAKAKVEAEAAAAAAAAAKADSVAQAAAKKGTKKK